MEKLLFFGVVKTFVFRKDRLIINIGSYATENAGDCDFVKQFEFVKEQGNSSRYQSIETLCKQGACICVRVCIVF